MTVAIIGGVLIVGGGFLYAVSKMMATVQANSVQKQIVAETPAPVATVVPQSTTGITTQPTVAYSVPNPPAQTIVQSNIPTIANNTNIASGSVIVSPSSIPMTEGATVTITGSGFKPNTKVELLGDQSQWANIMTSSTGTFTNVQTYNLNKEQVSNLAAAMINAGNRNYIQVRVWTYDTGQYSNSAYLYF